jgi:hypothetical protein
MTSSTLERERDKTSGTATISGPLGARPVVTGLGAAAHRRYEGQSFEQAEPELMRDWDRVKGISSLTWDNARHAVRDSWQRVRDFVERATPGDSDHDRK